MSVIATQKGEHVTIKKTWGNAKGINIDLDIEEAEALMLSLPVAIGRAAEHRQNLENGGSNAAVPQTPNDG